MVIFAKASKLCILAASTRAPIALPCEQAHMAEDINASQFRNNLGISEVLLKLGGQCGAVGGNS
jgi:hypothetical protein